MPEFVNPNKILSEVGITPGMTVADFGCGSGGWTIPLAKLLGKGRIFAVDIQQEPLSALTAKAKMAGVSNIIKIVSDVEERVAGIKDSSCDLVLITDLLFQVGNCEKVFGESYRVLKKGGRILVVEWKPESPLGPRSEKLSPSEVEKIAKQVGLSLDKKLDAGTYHFALIFVKS